MNRRAPLRSQTQGAMSEATEMPIVVVTGVEVTGVEVTDEEGASPLKVGPPGANLFVVRKMRRGEFDDFNDQQLQEAFERFGQLVRCEITVDKDTGISKGFGFVSYSTPEAADAAMAAMNGAMIGGRQIRIEKTSEDGR